MNLTKIYLVTPSILDIAHDANIDLDTLPNECRLSEQFFRHYPDGTIQIEGDECIDAFERRVRPLLQSRSMDSWVKNPLSGEQVLGGAFYVSLSPFPLETVDLIFYGDFVRQYETGLVRVRPVLPNLRPPAEDNPIEDLHVTVLFLRRLSKEVRQQFSSLVGAWMSSVSKNGMFGEGPIRRISREIDFYPHCARFRIDASRSGQNSINWLILSILHFNPADLVTDIFLVRRDDNERPLDEVYSQQDPKLVRLAIPIDETAHAPGVSKDNLSPASNREREDLIEGAYSDSLVALGTKDYDSLQSQHFRLLTRPDLQLENLETTIYFDELPGHDECMRLRQSLESWLKLGSEGAFGGAGFDAVGKVVFDEQLDAARIWCDTGITDWNLACRVLVNLLESWHQQGIIIKAVVFGRRPA